MGISEGDGYDFRRYDHVWQRVAPGVNPWAADPVPGRGAVSGLGNGLAVSAPPDRSGSAAGDPMPDPCCTGTDPCCMGPESRKDLPMLSGFLEAELSQRRQLLALGKTAPVWARGALRDLAAGSMGRARRLMAVWYLITGEAYCPAVSVDAVRVGRWGPALRERYHDAACLAVRYGQAAETMGDPCLGRLLWELSAAGYAGASELLRLVERSVAP